MAGKRHLREIITVNLNLARNNRDLFAEIFATQSLVDWPDVAEMHFNLPDGAALPFGFYYDNGLVRRIDHFFGDQVYRVEE